MSPPLKALQLSVASHEAGVRVDKWLANVPEIGSRSQAARLLEAGLVQANRKVCKPSYVVQDQDEIQVQIPQFQDMSLEPYALKLEILHEDEDVLVVNKPSGLVVHPAAGHSSETLVNALISHTDDLSMGFGEKRPGIVHRLDKETSGLLVVAKNNQAQEALVQQFKDRTVHRIYQAVSLGFPNPAQGTIESYIARHPMDRQRFASVCSKPRKIQRTREPIPEVGKWAVTNYKVLATKHGLGFLELKLQTGRTHQIRVHLSELGTPLAGDHRYGADKKNVVITAKSARQDVVQLERFLLHARELGFTHPKTGKFLSFEKNWPDADLALLKSWGFSP